VKVDAPTFKPRHDFPRPWPLQNRVQKAQ